MSKKAKALMVVGTGSDVGKSIVVTALCRFFSQTGKSVAPFKAQNMALNSYITIDGKEIGRAQGLQAEAAGIQATAEMNPVLLKPSKENISQVVVLGKPMADLEFRDYRETKYAYLKDIILKSLHYLKEQYELVIIEGAGSPVEMNLKDRDLVNMPVAEWADADVILVADIDRGGVFAQVVGTLTLLTEEERKRIKGVIINKFRGDLSLFESGIEWLENYTGIPILGVLPHINLPEWEEEDSVALAHKNQLKSNADIDIVVLKLPYLSNYTDFIPLQLEKDVQVRYISKPEEFGNPYGVIIPGTKNTIADLLFLKDSGLEKKILEHVYNNRELVGICGGYQMLGEWLFDPQQVESTVVKLKGLSLLPINTTFYPEKKTIRVTGNLLNSSIPVFGYEIHMGQVEWLQSEKPMFQLEDGSLDGGKNEILPVWGTFLHGVFDSDAFRHNWLKQLREKYSLPQFTERALYSEQKEAMFTELEKWFTDSLREEGLKLVQRIKG